MFIEWAPGQLLDFAQSVFALLPDGLLTAELLSEFGELDTGNCAFILGETLWDLIATAGLSLVHGVFFDFIDDTIVVIVFVVFEAHTLLDGGL